MTNMVFILTKKKAVKCTVRYLRRTTRIKTIFRLSPHDQKTGVIRTKTINQSQKVSNINQKLRSNFDKILKLLRNEAGNDDKSKRYKSMDSFCLPEYLTVQKYITKGSQHDTVDHSGSLMRKTITKIQNMQVVKNKLRIR